MCKANMAMLANESKEGFTVRNLMLVAVLATAAIPAYGQHPAGIGIDAGWGNFDNDVTDANAWLAGFRAGYNLLNWLELEGQVLGGGPGAGAVGAAEGPEPGADAPGQHEHEGPGRDVEREHAVEIV